MKINAIIIRLLMYIHLAGLIVTFGANSFYTPAQIPLTAQRLPDTAMGWNIYLLCWYFTIAGFLFCRKVVIQSKDHTLSQLVGQIGMLTTIIVFLLLSASAVGLLTLGGAWL